MANYIPDGYTISGIVKGDKSVGTTDVSLTYRPATGGETNAWIQDRMRGDGKKHSEANSNFMNDHIVKWDISNNGKAIEVTPANCGRLHSALITKICDIISGFDNLDVIHGEEVQSEQEARGN